MNFIKNSKCNHHFGPPPGVSDDDCGTLHVQRRETRFGMMHTSFWKPDAGELAALNSGASVALHIYGQGHPMVAMGIEPKEKGND